jgi:hypothetical protein
MSDQALILEILAKFYREVMRPDIRRIVEESERRLCDDIRRMRDAMENRTGALERRDDRG